MSPVGLLTRDYSMKLTTVNAKKQGPKGGETGEPRCARVTGKPEVANGTSLLRLDDSR